MLPSVLLHCPRRGSVQDNPRSLNSPLYISKRVAQQLCCHFLLAAYVPPNLFESCHRQRRFRNSLTAGEISKIKKHVLPSFMRPWHRRRTSKRHARITHIDWIWEKLLTKAGTNQRCCSKSHFISATHWYGPLFSDFVETLLWLPFEQRLRRLMRKWRFWTQNSKSFA